jgi:hypothetical protein
MTTSKLNIRSPKKQRPRRAGISHLRLSGVPSASRHSSSKSTDDSDEDNEDVPLMTGKDHPSRRIVSNTKTALIAPVKDRAVSTDNINKVTSGSSSLPAAESQSSLASPHGSSSSLEMDTTDNEVYKTVIPVESSRRENSLALMLNRAISETVETTASSHPQLKSTSNLQTPAPSANED